MVICMLMHSPGCMTSRVRCVAGPKPEFVAEDSKSITVYWFFVKTSQRAVSTDSVQSVELRVPELAFHRPIRRVDKLVKRLFFRYELVNARLDSIIWFRMHCTNFHTIIRGGPHLWEPVWNFFNWPGNAVDKSIKRKNLYEEIDWHRIDYSQDLVQDNGWLNPMPQVIH